MALQSNHIIHLANLFRRGQDALFEGAFEFNDAFEFLRETQHRIWKDFGTSAINDLGKTVTEALQEAWYDDSVTWPEDAMYRLTDESYFEVGPDNLLSMVKIDPLTGMRLEIKNMFEE